jgi:quercetin dioxygenase-like cupin family protein
MPPMVNDPAELHWGPGPAFLPNSVQAAVLAGDLRSGPWVIRLKLPAGYEGPPHFHTNTENVTVLSGDFHVGMGDVLDKTKGYELRAGGFVSMPPQMHHYVWTTTETVIQLHSDTPASFTYVNPADDPRNARSK